MRRRSGELLTPLLMHDARTSAMLRFTSFLAAGCLTSCGFPWCKTVSAQGPQCTHMYTCAAPQAISCCTLQSRSQVWHNCPANNAEKRQLLRTLINNNQHNDLYVMPGHTAKPATSAPEQTVLAAAAGLSMPPPDAAPTASALSPRNLVFDGV